MFTNNFKNEFHLHTCRACLSYSSNKTMLSLFSKSTDAQLINADMFRECASIQVLPLDGFPQNLCMQCSEKLVQFYKFKTTCKQSDKKLRTNMRSSDFKTSNRKDELCFGMEINDDSLEFNEHDKCNSESMDLTNVLDNKLPQITLKIKSDKSLKDNIQESSKSIVTKLQAFNTEKHNINLTFHCKYCRNIFRSAKLLKQHTKSHMYNKALNIITDPFRCKWECCTVSFKNHTELRMHMSNVHDRNLIYNCSQCQESFQYLKALQKHMKTLKHNYVPPVKQNLCWICGKLYLYSNELQSHMFVHSGVKPYKCTECDKTFSAKVNLYSHKTVHTKKTKRTCNICGKMFTRISAFNQHMKIHTGDLAHQCSICERRFLRPRQLVEHMVTHTGARDYECDLCGKKFGRKRNLVAHRYIHTGEKPKVCEICGAAFIQTTSLHLHMKKHQKK